jgi:glycerol-3-phosphate dehydrogenase
MTQSGEITDLLVVGGGVNGVGVARDAAGRGLSVHLVEQGDLGGATSSASTKLFHGGLRYLEHYAFGLVRKALIEREVLLANMPHISKPMRFVLPHAKGMRPAWLLRLGLFLYDHMGGRKLLPGTKVLDLRRDLAGKSLKSGFRKAFEYSDGWVDDARLVILNARDAADRGAVIQTRMRLESAARVDGVWLARLKDMRSGKTSEIRARALLNAGGPWVNKVIEGLAEVAPPDPVRLVRGSHIVVPRLFDHERAYFFQLPDGRIIFAIPYEEDFTCIGTTDVDHKGDAAEAVCSPEEVEYLCNAASEYFVEPVLPDHVVWTYSGVRPLDDVLDGDASKASRDYHIKVGDVDGKAPLISIYGGKITTYRKLAEQAVAELAPYVELLGLPWTTRAPLPGGDFAFDGRADLVGHLSVDYPFLAPRDARRLVAAYGTMAWKLLGDAKEEPDLGQDFGAGLCAREVEWLMTREWAQSAEDILWRRTKCGLRMTADQIKVLEDWVAKR